MEQPRTDAQQVQDRKQSALHGRISGKYQLHKNRHKMITRGNTLPPQRIQHSGQHQEKGQKRRKNLCRKPFNERKKETPGR